MTEYIKYGISLSENQKTKLAKALMSKAPITLRLSHSELEGPDELYLTKSQIKRIQKSKSMNKGVDLKLSKTQITHVKKEVVYSLRL